MGLIALLFTEIFVVHFFISNAVLKERNFQEFKIYWDLSYTINKVKYHTYTNFAVEEKEIVIIDEADLILYEKPLAFFTLIENSKFICLTETDIDWKARE